MSVSPNLINAAVTLTAAQIDGMYASPVLVIPGVPNMLVRVLSTTFNPTYGGTAFAGGGALGIFYGNASPASNCASTNFCDPALLTGLAANAVGGISSVILATFTLSSAAIGAGVYVSNQLGPFTGGAGASMIVNCLYYLIPGVQ